MGYIKKFNEEYTFEHTNVYVLFQSDIHKTKSTYVFFGVFSSYEKAVDEAKANDLYTNEAEVIIEEVTMNEFTEI